MILTMKLNNRIRRFRKIYILKNQKRKYTKKSIYNFWNLLVKKNNK